MLDPGIPFLCHEYKYSSSDSTKSPASGIATLGKPSLMSHVGESAGSRMRIKQCFSAIGRWRCQYSYGSLRADTSVARLQVEYRQVTSGILTDLCSSGRSMGRGGHLASDTWWLLSPD